MEIYKRLKILHCKNACINFHFQSAVNTETFATHTKDKINVQAPPDSFITGVVFLC